MSRDRYLFGGLTLAFVALNGVLLGSGRLPVNWTGFGIIVAAGLTLLLYSFLYKDNPLFKFAEHIYVGTAAAYVFGQYWFGGLFGMVIEPVFMKEDIQAYDKWLLLIPTLLGALMLTRFSRRWAWVSRISFAFYVGVGAGLTIPRYISSFVLQQIEPTLRPLSLTMEGFDVLVILVGVVSVLVYFFFSVEHTGVVGGVSKVGIYFLMVAFGASFGYTIMARLSLLIGRVSFLLEEWLRIPLTL
jgi:hypothetical protein